MAGVDSLLSLKPTVTEEAELVASNVKQAPPPSLADLITEHTQAQSEVQTNRDEIGRTFTLMQNAVHAFQQVDLDVDDQERVTLLKAQREAEDTYNKAVEAYVVVAARLEHIQNDLIPVAQAHYCEQQRDKRGEEHLACPTWAPSQKIIVDPHDSSRTTLVTYSEGCKCDHMPVRHDKQEENPWCAACQDAHTDGTAPHPAITEEQFVRRILTSAQ